MSGKRGASEELFPGTPPLNIHQSTFELVIEPRNRMPVVFLALVWLLVSAIGTAVLALKLPLFGAVVVGAGFGMLIASIGALVSFAHIRTHVARGPYLHADLRAKSVRLGHAGRELAIDEIQVLQWASGVIKPSPYHNSYEPRSWVFVETGGERPALALVCVNPRVRGGAKRIAETAAEFLRKPCQRISLEVAVRNSGSG